jgi:hypothetical protein
MKASLPPDALPSVHFLDSRHPKRAFVLFGALFLLSSFARAQIACRSSQTKDPDFQSLQVSTLQELSSSGVFEIKDSQHRTFVIRFEGLTSNPAFEVAVSPFLRHFLGHSSHTEVLPVPPEISEKILDALRQHPKADQQFSAPSWQERKKKNGVYYLPASITLKTEGLLGTDFLSRYLANELPLKIQKKVSEGALTTEEVDHLWKSWGQMDSQARADLEVHLQRIFQLPSLRAWKKPDFNQWLMRLKQANQAELTEYFNTVLEPVPSLLKINLFEAWTLYRLLQIPDLHSANWMIETLTNRLVVIDAAYLRAHAPEELWQNGLHQPFGGTHISPAMLSWMVQQLPPEFKQRLRTEALPLLEALLRQNPVPGLDTKKYLVTVKRTLADLLAP